MHFLKLALVFLVGYLLGSIDFGILVSKYLYKDDVRNHGSGNAGATNMLRTYGKKRAFLTVLGDALKGTFSVLFAKYLFSYTTYIAQSGVFTVAVMREIAIYVAVLAAVIGHMYPIFFKFKGGKGVATGFGSMLRASPIVCVVAFCVFVLTVLKTRVVSLSSIIACASFFLTTIIIQMLNHTLGMPHAMIQLTASFVLPMIVVYAHRANIKRLLNGTEYKFTSNKK